ncbi:hypothetical protein BDW75DRAFT_206969 [Aspergillus navahoensis]
MKPSGSKRHALTRQNGLRLSILVARCRMSKGPTNHNVRKVIILSCLSSQIYAAVSYPLESDLGGNGSVSKASARR